MIAESHRGEVIATIDGRPFRLCLTLGALAELEAGFGVASLPALAERLSAGALSARDLQRLIAAGLRGGGHRLADEDVADMRFEGGVTGAAALAARLIEASFAPLAGATGGEGGR